MYLSSKIVLGNISRKVPINYIVLGLFTLFESYMVSFVCYMYTPQSVILAATATLAATIGLTYYAMTTKEDFTSFRFVGKGTTKYNHRCLGLSLLDYHLSQPDQPPLPQKQLHLYGHLCSICSHL